MKIRIKNQIKYNGLYHLPGVVLDIPEKEITDSLINAGAAEAVGKNAVTLTPVQQLQNVPGVNAKIAEILVQNGVDTVDKLSGESIEDLKKFGIAASTAKKIYRSFE